MDKHSQVEHSRAYLDISSGISGGVDKRGSRVIISLMYVEEEPLAKKSSSFYGGNRQERGKV
jgi:hypothetical protein